MKAISYESCLEEAKKYEYLYDFRKGSAPQYRKSLSSDWLKNFYWLKRGKLNRPLKWTEESTFAEAKKYLYFSDFSRKSPGAYTMSKKNGWLKSYTWLKRKSEIDITQNLWCVYVYLIDQKYVYVGLTNDIKRRDYEHKNSKKDHFFNFCEENNLKIPKYKLIKENITGIEAQKLEDDIKNEYFNKPGWIVINVGKTGVGIGSLGSSVQKWDRQSCYNVALKCKTRVEFRRRYPRAYVVSHRNGWFSDYSWLPKYVPNNKVNETPVVQYDINGNYISTFESIKKAKKYLGITSKSSIISKICKTKNGNAYGYKWRYLSDVLDIDGNILKKILI